MQSAVVHFYFPLKTQSKLCKPNRYLNNRYKFNDRKKSMQSYSKTVVSHKTNRSVAQLNERWFIGGLKALETENELFENLLEVVQKTLL